MCRRCGERDKRPHAKQRRELSRRIIERDGDPQAGTVPCTWQIHPACPRVLTAATMERDRLIRGGTYRLDNLVASCPPCNRQRYLDELRRDGVDWPDGCEYGPEALPA